MFVSANLSEGIPSRLYRSPAEIRLDIISITNRIKETNEMISHHALVTETLCALAKNDPRKWIGALEEAIEVGREAKKQLEQFEKSLDELREELEDVRWILGT